VVSGPGPLELDASWQPDAAQTLCMIGLTSAENVLVPVQVTLVLVLLLLAVSEFLVQLIITSKISTAISESFFIHGFTKYKL
jgi:hypothetical protein